MQALIEIGGRIVVTDILTEKFCCDLRQCHGMCCVEGNAGAPLEEDEVAVLEAEYPNYADCMTEAGRQVIEQQGFYVVDEDGDYTSAIEKAYREGHTYFKKPISCHLYPIRISRFGDGSEGLNYHRWNICASARKCGMEKGIRVYEGLREPIERRFGKEFYDELDAAAKYLDSNPDAF